MPRRGGVKPRKIDLDPVYSERLVTKIINNIMRDGKRSVAQRQVYNALDLIKERTKQDPVKIFIKAVDNVKPSMEVRPRRVGGAAYQVPMPVRGRRRETLSLRWIIAAARARSNSQFHTFAEKLATELIEASQGEGGAMKKRSDVEKMAEANRAFAHFRW